MKQGTQEWKLSRVGYVTASRISDLMTRTKTGWGAGRKNYMAQLIAERLTGIPEETFKSSAMHWGTDTEPKARAAYSFYSSVNVHEVGFILHPTIPMAGCSSDGFVGDDGQVLIEIKCPNSATHIDTLLDQEVPEKYVKQMQFQMACTGRSWCDFVSFDPRMPVQLEMFVKRVDRDSEMIAQIEMAVRDFLLELDRKLTMLKELSYGL